MEDAKRAHSLPVQATFIPFRLIILKTAGLTGTKYIAHKICVSFSLELSFPGNISRSDKYLASYAGDPSRGAEFLTGISIFLTTSAV
jgi:hypothetical protein